MTDMGTETGPEVLVEDPMTQRLLLLAEGGNGTVDELHEIDIQVPPPVYTIKDEHLDNSNINGNDVSSESNPSNVVSRSSSGANRATIEPTVIRIPNVAPWVAESRRDTYQRFASPDSSEHYSFGFVSTFPDSDYYYHHQNLLHGSSSSTAAGAGAMRILPSMGVLYPSVIVHM
ncbi:hypothetical protein BGW39_002109 [Mortierella sp. 14UC]|nr:hypothetical protein BGW39_002109 [Mortierella sp. 14UC]